jgi:hypothetical protein
MPKSWCAALPISAATAFPPNGPCCRGLCSQLQKCRYSATGQALVPLDAVIKKCESLRMYFGLLNEACQSRFALLKSLSLLRSASLRAGLRRKEGFLWLSLPSIYEPACAQNRAQAGSTCWANLFRPYRGWFSRQPMNFDSHF